MKKYRILISLTLLSMVLINGCKKDSDSKNATASVSDKTWWGGLTYSGKTQEYYSVHFNADKSLLWSQLSGDYPGQWAISGKQLTISFTGIPTTIKADITDAGTLANISDDNPSSTINSGQMVPNPAIILDNTNWSMVVGSTSGYTLVFQPGLKVGVLLGGAVVASLTYKRLPSGGGIQINNSGSTFFGVVTSDTEMKGSNGNSETPWQATKK